jgi:hypothetical protein
MFLTRFVEKKYRLHFTLSNFYYANHAVYEIIWKNTMDPDRPQITTVWHMGIACWIHKATNTYSEYVIFIASPLQTMVT